MALQNAFANLALDTSLLALKIVDPDGTVQVSNDSKALFLDAFDGTLGAWTTGGTAPSISNGMVTFASNTTASTASYMRTNLTFLLRPQAYVRAGHFVQFETGVVTNSTRWWGYGQSQSSPTAATPVLNGAVFVLDYADGLLYGATYSAGTRTQRVALTRPTDGGLHKYEIWWRQAIVYFVIDGVTVGSITYPNTAITSGMYSIAGSVNHTTAPSAAPVLRLSSASMADTSGTVGTIGDGNSPTIQATVRNVSTGAAASTDTSLVVSLRDAIPAGSATIGAVGLNAGSNVVGAVGVQAVTPSALYYTSTGTNAAQQAKTSAGYVQALVITNTSANTQWVKVYNATSVTLGTTAAVLDIPLASGATVSLNTGPNGIRMTTGIAYAITGAVGATNNTANTAGVLIALTYV